MRTALLLTHSTCVYSKIVGRIGGFAMNIKPVRTKRDYDAALRAIEPLMSAKRNTPEGDRLDVLVTLVEAYEAKHFPLDLPDPVEAIKFVMEQRNLTVKVK
jgi:HTH-type transcriptional regulator / antitoxin HigA